MQSLTHTSQQPWASDGPEMGYTKEYYWIPRLCTLHRSFRSKSMTACWTCVQLLAASRSSSQGVLVGWESWSATNDLQRGVYDKILLDAPCSSECHVLYSLEALAEWSPSKTKRMDAQQHAMLCAALDAVRVSGLILYSTCSISSAENQDCIEKLIKKRPGQIEVVDLQGTVEGGEPCTYGHQFWPDVTGTGPIYCCLLKKISDEKSKP
ncbi:hypothetical protein AC1031_021489 [Aphanomyces cochlioides]|nr:hypothetical protein AC1031_021489 [Aphanomyces cochlioides]